jgi:hypothetical protein
MALVRVAVYFTNLLPTSFLKYVYYYFLLLLLPLLRV